MEKEGVVQEHVFRKQGVAGGESAKYTRLKRTGIASEA